jgi:lipoprotein-releasing system ATP-binding protein
MSELGKRFLRQAQDRLLHPIKGGDAGRDSVAAGAAAASEGADAPVDLASRLEPFPVDGGPAVALRAAGLTKTYAAVAKAGRKDSATAGELELFRGLDLTVHAGEMVAIVGESGAGKSSLLHLLAALDTASSGEVWYGETRLSGMSAREAAEFRNRRVGYVWQFHYLLPEFTALENVAMPLLARGMGRSGAMSRAKVWLERVGLADREEHRSGELSGGEQQRVSLARALVTDPQVLLADEPTGDLDGRTAESVFGLIQKLHKDHGLTSVLVTHNLEFAGRCDRLLRLKDGKLLEAADLQ